MRRTGLALAGALVGLAAAPASAATLTLEPIGTATYDAPTYVTSDPTNPDRLFVTEQDGTIYETTPAGTRLFLDLEAETADPSGTEEGLWSIAFAPDFATSRRFYVAYSATDHAPTVEGYEEGATPAETEATHRLVLKAEDNPVTANHNGGQLQFGPDGYLYWSIGEDAVMANSQTVTNLRGKILRIDPRGTLPGEYIVPADNPFVATPGARDEIWALGLRNPWRFSFDRLTGALVIADVGGGQREEVNYASQAAGGGIGVNYGWPICEGVCLPPQPALTDPIYAYTHGPAQSAITGGYVVRDPGLDGLYGRYLFADLGDGELRSIDPTAPPALDGDRREGISVGTPTTFGEDACGRIYVAGFGDGRVYRLEGPSGGACPATALPDTEPPDTGLKLKRKNRRGTRYVARISASEAGSSFECKLDRGRWKSCGAKRKLKRLDPGRHRFRARATDAAGNTDPTPAKKRFRVRRR